jgi:multiple sugar transport system permease protein
MIRTALDIATGFKSPSDAISYPPNVFFEPTLEGYVNLFTRGPGRMRNSSPQPPQTCMKR